MSATLKDTSEDVQRAAAWVATLRKEIGHVIVGQEHLVDRLLVGLLANGHVLLEGVPGLAKTLSVRTLAAARQCHCPRLSWCSRRRTRLTRRARIRCRKRKWTVSCSRW